jgi:hypothetical protein
VILVWFINFSPNYAAGIAGQQNLAILSSVYKLLWIERIESYIDIQNEGKCLRLKKNKVE